MFKRDIRINYEILDDILNDLRMFYASLNEMEEAMKRLDSLLLESEGKSIEALRKKKVESLEVIGKYKEQILETSNLLNGYIWEMTGIIKPINRAMMTQVDRNDIWWNINSIQGGVIGFNIQGGSTGPSRPYRDYVDDKKAEYNREVIRHNEWCMDEMENAMLLLYKKLTRKADELLSIHKSKVIPYEDKDDEYDYKAKKLGDRYQDFWGGVQEFLFGGFEFIGHSVAGLLHGAWNVVSGLFMLVIGVIYTSVAGVSWLVCKVFGWDVPKWISDPLDSINSILKDPTLILEGMLQRYSDVGDVKGYDYLAFMIGGEIITASYIGKLLEKLKNSEKIDWKTQWDKLNNHTNLNGRSGDLPKTSAPNSSMDLYVNGNLWQRRFYDAAGNMIKDIDFYHTGNNHIFPHEHFWEWINGIPKRK